MNDCPFCNINTERIRVLENKKSVVVVFSDPRLMPGHLLVVPKRHVERISGLSKEEQKELWETVVEFQEKILDRIAKGCDIRQNYRPFQEQGKLKIHHLHIHLQPRELFDELYKKCQVFEKDIFKDLSHEELDKTTKVLKS